jgi:hypothetical protein
VHPGTQTKNLAQTLFLFSACSLAAIFLFVAATARHHDSAQYSVNSPLYTYQNPFNQPASPSPSAFSQANAGSTLTSSMLTKLLSVRWFAGLSGLGALWLGASCYLYGGHRNRKRVRHNAEYTMDTPTRMNPLAAIPPKQVMPVAEQDKVSFPVSTVLCRPNTRSCFAHRTTIAPCQSRFRPTTLRPTTLASSRTRFGRLK